MRSNIMDEDEWSTDYTNRCGNCHKGFHEDEKYCRYCGTKRGEGKFEPYKNVMQCIYGPMPIKRVHRCTVCNYTWNTMSMIDNQRFCPECGAGINTYEGKELEKIASLLPADSIHSVLIVSTKKSIPLLESETTIGRKEANTISIQNRCVSGYHARIQEIDGEYFLKDNNSTNGTLLNGIKLSPFVPVKLSKNDRILLAGVEELIFV